MISTTWTPVGEAGYKSTGYVRRRSQIENTPQRTKATHSAQFSVLVDLSNMSSQTRTIGDKTFNAIGYGSMGLSIAYGPVGTDEERLKVHNLYIFHRYDVLLIFAGAIGYRRRLRVRLYFLGHC